MIDLYDEDFRNKEHKAGVRESAMKADIRTEIAIVIANC
jgi:hypothetical protein